MNFKCAYHFYLLKRNLRAAAVRKIFSTPLQNLIQDLIHGGLMKIKEEQELRLESDFEVSTGPMNNIVCERQGLLDSAMKPSKD